MKILLGLLEPEEGQVLVDGVPLSAATRVLYRRRVAAVMQEDTLLSGTIGDNICFFDPRPNRERIEYCADVARIANDIKRFPMGYHTLVGDMGAALSGGQKQRILIARALYHSPSILFLDEATSHVDRETERRIHKALGELRVTRVIVAHRQETLAIADHVLTWGDIEFEEPEKPLLEEAAA